MKWLRTILVICSLFIFSTVWVNQYDVNIVSFELADDRQPESEEESTNPPIRPGREQNVF